MNGAIPLIKQFIIGIALAEVNRPEPVDTFQPIEEVFMSSKLPGKIQDRSGKADHRESLSHCRSRQPAGSISAQPGSSLPSCLEYVKAQLCMVPNPAINQLAGKKSIG
jgi:hypothetical protein